MVYILKQMTKHKKSYLFLVLFEVLTGVIITTIGLFLTQSVVTMVAQKVDIQQFVITTTVLVSLLGLFKFLLIRINIETAINQQYFRGRRLYDLSSQISDIDYQLVETDSYKEAQEKAFYCVNGDSSLFQIFPQNLSKFLRVTIQIVLFGSLLSVINASFIILIVLLLIVVIIYRSFQQRYVNSTRKERAQYIGQLNYIDRVSSNFALAKDIRLFNVNPWFSDIFNHVITNIRRLTFKRLMFNFGGQVISAGFILLLQGFGYWILLQQFLQNQISIGEVTFFIGAITTIASNSSDFVNLVFDLIDNSEDVSNLIDFENYPLIFNHTSTQPVPENIETIEFKNVVFGYPKADKKIFDNFNLKINKNEKIALVGLNGAGKTTLIKLLCNLYKPESGQILINNKDNQSFNVKDYYKLFSVVFQDSYTLPISIKETITQDSPFDQEKFEETLAKANFKDTVESFPNKEDSLLVKDVHSEGLTLSGGQNQKLKMAQAFYKDAPILILDEPTSALDPLAESEVYQQYYENSLNKISVFVTHRLATTQFCDRILFLEHGRIVEDGTHQELLNLKQKFYEMYEKQAYYYKEGVTHE